VGKALSADPTAPPDPVATCREVGTHVTPMTPLCSPIHPCDTPMHPYAPLCTPMHPYAPLCTPMHPYARLCSVVI